MQTAWPLFVALALLPTSASGQQRQVVPDLSADDVMRRSVLPTGQAEPMYARKMAGLGAGMTAGAIFMSLDGVLGSSCTGSGNYLTLCRAGFVAALAVGGGVGTLVGVLVRSGDPPGRTTRILVGTAVGSLGAFLVSTLACRQGDFTNPEYLCGHDGMVSTPAVLGAAAVGGVLGAALGSESGRLRLRRVGPLVSSAGRIGVGAAVSVTVR